ncbi:MAG TPA: hypothetical protein VHY08_01185, partial [Bacillota bacterium]|nr:hypothetical protein [Bacillota bacterium]
MKLKLGLILILVVCVLSLPVFADNREEQFWQTISRGDYLAAGQLAVNIGATNSEYYYLAGICYQNSFRYRESNLYFQKYGRFGNPVKLGNLLKDRIQKSKSDPEVLILAGIAGILETNLGL